MLSKVDGWLFKSRGMGVLHCFWFREFCLAPEDDTEDVLVSDPVKDEQNQDKDDASEGAKKDNIQSDRVEDEKDDKKKFLKTSRVCQFFNIC